MKSTFQLTLLLLAIASFPSCRLLAQCQNTEVFLNTITGNYADEMSYELLDEEDNIIYSFQGTDNYTTELDSLCLENGCYQIKSYDSYGDGWNGATLNLTWDGDSLWVELLDGSSGFEYFGINHSDCIPEVSGCTDPAAYNYNPLATEDDGSCLDL